MEIVVAINVSNSVFDNNNHNTIKLINISKDTVFLSILVVNRRFEV